jgi:hypothetical protein
LGPKTFLAKKGQKNMTTEGPFFRQSTVHHKNPVWDQKHFWQKKGKKI